MENDAGLKKEKKPKKIIGWHETIDFPELDIWALPAKIDTGARTSSIHVEDIKILANNRVQFTVILHDEKPRRKKTLIQVINRTKPVRTNHRHVDDRIFIRTILKLGQIEKEIDLNLTNRSDLRYRLILGRSAVSKHFLIDPQKGGLASK